MITKAKSIFTTLLLIISILTLIGCNNNETYLARFIDWDDTLIEEVTVNSSAFEDIKDFPDDPVREGYTFDKWIGSFDSIANVIIVKATYQIDTYTIVWKNHDGSVLATDSNVEWGSTPSYGGTTPTKAATAEFDYTFIGWSPTVAVATSNQEYVAQFSETIKTYTVIWKNHDGSVLETDNDVINGIIPEYNGLIPLKTETTQYTYVFEGWSPQISNVNNNIEYTAVFQSILVEYSVSVYLESELYEYEVEYGETLGFLNDYAQSFADAYYLVTWYDNPTLNILYQLSPSELSSTEVIEDMSVYGKKQYIPYTYIASGKSQLTWDSDYYYDISANTIIEAKTSYYNPAYFYLYVEAGQTAIVATRSDYLNMNSNTSLAVASGFGEYLNGGTAINITRKVDSFGYPVLEFNVSQSGIYYIAVLYTNSSLTNFDYVFSITASTY